MRVTVTKEARRDLIAIREYIRGELLNESAARRIMKALKKSVLSLEQFPERGRPLDALLPVHTDYRYLVCENYCIFYLCDERSAVVLRILHQRQEALKALFISGADGDAPEDDPQEEV